MTLRNQMLSRAARRFFDGYMGQVEKGCLEIILPGGERLLREGQQPGAKGTMEVKRWRTFSKVMRRGDIGFAEGYVAGDWESPDLSALMTVLAQNIDSFNDDFSPRGLDRWLTGFQHALRRNTKSQSRKNIEAHYDLGNDFYQLWLDPSMTYSSAIFEAASQDLPLAQAAKYQRILDQAELKPNSNILEIGCGWGGFAEAAAAAGHQVTGVTISPAQLAFAERRLAKEIQAGAVELRLQDYRDIPETFDAVVSIEMFEAVGQEWWETFMQKVRGSLSPGAKAIIQTITMKDEFFEGYASQADFIQTCIFPGSMLASPGRFTAQAANQGLQLEGQHFFGRSYAETLRHWQSAFNGAENEVRGLGFDSEFIRLWNFYYSYCVGGFEAERTSVGQFSFRAA